MEEYSNFEEKGKYFKNGSMKIFTNDDYELNFKKIFLMSSTNDFIFRGVCEAKFQMYNHAQREWIKHNSNVSEDEYILFDSFIKDKIYKCKKWNNGTVSNLFKTYDIAESDSLAYLAFMQHYGIPTPLLDFTSDPTNALYFAVENINYINDSPNEIDNYFSIYCNYQNNTAFDVFYEVYKSNIMKANNEEIDYNLLSLNQMLLVTDRYKEFKILNNIRIANQKGIFFYNNDPRTPLEKLYIDFIAYLEKKIGVKALEEQKYHNTVASCFNIHKKYANHIKERLNEMGINKDYIYPRVELLKEEIEK